MGASSSKEQEVSAEQREAESLAASLGALQMLQQAFSIFSDPQAKAIPVNSLQNYFGLTFEKLSSEATSVPEAFPVLVSHLGASIADLFFFAEKDGVTWIEFLRGFTKCCGRSTASTSLNCLFRLFATTAAKAGLPTNLQFESDHDECKMSGSLSPTNFLMLLWICWLMSWDARCSKSCNGNTDNNLPDVNHLVLSAVASCVDVDGDLNVWDCNVLDLDDQLPLGKIHLWALKTMPNLADCFTQFVYARLHKSINCEDKLDPSCSSVSDTSSTAASESYLLTCGRAWAISLTLRSNMREEILKVCFRSDIVETNENLLYRSSLHGKSLNRFWSNVEGYNAPLLMLIAASAADSNDGNDDVKRWIIGALCHQGFENREHFYGTTGSLYAISPVFNVFSSLGKEKNFVYSHLHPTMRVYEPHPKPVGIAFGGSTGNERVYVDEDFARITIRHHVTDKTYQPGPLFPYQGFLPHEAVVLEMEVWGLGGKTAKDVQTSYKRRENLFTEQRRKVDVKTFGSWEDAPEKMMMDMISDPNSVRREDR